MYYAGWGWMCIYLFNFIIMACALDGWERGCCSLLRFLCISVSLEVSVCLFDSADLNELLGMHA